MNRLRCQSVFLIGNPLHLFPTGDITYQFRDIPPKCIRSVPRMDFHVALGHFLHSQKQKNAMSGDLDFNTSEVPMNAIDINSTTGDKNLKIRPTRKGTYDYPYIGTRPIDLYLLHNAVLQLGGPENVSKFHQWEAIYAAMKLPRPDAENAPILAEVYSTWFNERSFHPNVDEDVDNEDEKVEMEM